MRVSVVITVLASALLAGAPASAEPDLAPSALTSPVAEPTPPSEPRMQRWEGRADRPRAGLTAPVLTARGEANGVRFTWTRGAPSTTTGVTWEFDPVDPADEVVSVQTRSYVIRGDSEQLIKARVRARVGNRFGPWSQIRGARVEVAYPASLTARATSPTQAEVTWSSVPKADAYEVSLEGDLLKKVDGSRLSTNIGNLKPGETYSIRVRAVVNGVRSPWSPPANVTMPPTPAPSPTNLQVTALSSNEATITWTPPDGATSFEVFLDNTRVATTFAPNNFAALRGLIPGTTYSVKVTATVGGVTSAPSVPVGFTTPLLAPTGLTVSSVTQTTATFAWTPMVGATNYEVFLDGVLVSSTVTGNSYVFTTLAAGQTYQAAVRARFPSGLVSGTSLLTFTTALATAPTGLAITGITATSATLTWLPVLGASSYDVFLNGAQVGSSVSVNFYAFTGLAGGQTYQVAVRSRFSTGAVSGLSTSAFTTSIDPAQAPVNTAVPVATLTGFVAPTPGALLIASAGTWTSQTPVAYAYQWQRSVDNSVFEDIAGATTSAYVVRTSDIGNHLRVRVTASNPNGSTARASTSLQAVAIVAPSAIPQVAGFAVVDDTLTFIDVSWSSVPPPTLTLAWQQSTDGSTWSNIAGGNRTFLALDDTSFGKYIRVVVTATVRDGSVTYNSEPRGPVASSFNTVAPVVTGTTTVGQTLSTTSGTWRPADTTLAYSWQRYDALSEEWNAISGATSATYVLRTADAGHLVRSVVSSTNTSASTVPVYAYSAAVGPVVSLVNLTGPVISGVPNTTVALTTTTGVWTPSAGVSFAYQWQRSSDLSSWFNIAGATSSTYTPAADAGFAIRVSVTATSGLLSSTVLSAPTTRVNAPFNTVSPSVSGVARAGAVLTGSLGTWATGSNTPTDDTIQWQSSSDGVIWANIVGATTSSYTPDLTVASRFIRLAITRSNASGASIAYSSATGRVLPPFNTVAPTIGSPRLVKDDSVWITFNGTWSPDPAVVTATSFTYQWQRSADGGATWTDITGATADTYFLTSADVARLVRCRVQVAGYTSGESSAVSNVMGPVGP